MLLRRLATLAAALAVVVSACGGPSTPALTDPKDILAKAIAALQTARTAHIHIDLAGTFNAAVPGLGTGGAGGLKLDGTSGDIDTDIPNKDTHVSLTLPASLLGMTVDLIVIGNDTYLKVPLLDPKYTKSTTSDVLSSFVPSGAPAVIGNVTDPAQILTDIKTALDKLVTPPVKDPDEQCGDQTCYKVTVTVTPADAAAAGSALGTGISGSGTIDIWVRHSDLMPAKAVATVNGGSQGSLTITLTVSNINTPVTIAAPPADQISTGQ
jgi:hypothetical protein